MNTNLMLTRIALKIAQVTGIGDGTSDSEDKKKTQETVKKTQENLKKTVDDVVKKGVSGDDVDKVVGELGKSLEKMSK